MATIHNHIFPGPHLAPERTTDRNQYGSVSSLEALGNPRDTGNDLSPALPKRGGLGGRRNLTDKVVKALRPAPTGKRVQYLDAVVPGLRLRITDRGAKSWSLVKWIDGRSIRAHIGTYPGVGVALA